MERRKIFLDVGAHHGESVCRFFKGVGGRAFWTWKVYCFEANPSCFAELLKNHGKIGNISFHNVAVTGNLPEGVTTRELYVGEKHSGEGSTLVVGKKTGWIDYQHPIQVAALPLAVFVQEALLPTDYVVMKLNIEGGEYEIMQHILDEGIINRFDQMYIQTHKHKLDLTDYQHYADLETRFMDAAQSESVELTYVKKEVIEFKPNPSQTRKVVV